jgi:predicted AlkP superfamily pyrophosphatase or phosphodiesterase
MTAGLTKPGKDYYETVTWTPFGNELLLDFVLRAVEAENLGAGNKTDYLTVSFSSNDLLGHQYGPDSQEVLDVTLRSDLIVRDLLNALDRKVGKGRYALALSADHGICPIPEVSAAHGKNARRVQIVPLLAAAAAHLSSVYGTPGGKEVWIETQEMPWVYLNYKLLAARGLRAADVTEAVAAYLRRQPSIQAVYTRTQIEGLADDEFLRLLRKSYVPDRCGDLAIISKPYHLMTTYATGTTHGTPHEYDRHVPLILAGPGVPPGRSDEPVTPQAAVPFLAWAAGVPPPATAEAPLPERLRRK